MRRLGVVAGIALLGAAAPALAGRPAAAPRVTHLVLLGAPTRWDGWRAVAGPASSSPALPAARRAAAKAAADAAGAHIARVAAPIAAAVARAGGDVVARYDTAAAALLVRLPSTSGLDLAALAGVRAVRPAPLAQQALLDSAPAIGARRVARELGVDGVGTVVAVADSGVDYTHASLGGPGVEDAYVAARSAAERIDDAWAGRTLFPNAKVIAGWDFAGPLYAPDCDPILERMGRCSATPSPDPDPLDTYGHGTHVAAIAAGLDSGPVAAGVAPGAALVALKIFGASGRTELILDPLEWVLEANMGAAGRPHVDVLNFSLGQLYGGEVLSETGAVRRAVEAGVVVVAAVGNDGDLPFIAAAPAVAPEALAVASHVPPGRHGYEASLRVGRGAPRLFGEDSVYHQGWSPDPRQPVTERLVYVGRGCPAADDQAEDPYLADPRGAIGVFQMAWGAAGASCTADRQARRLQSAGALGALMATGIGAQAASAWEAEPTVDIPVFMIADDLEQAVVTAAGAGDAIAVTLSPVAHPDLTGVVSDFSSRGPDRSGAPKPDLSAPGTGIVSAAVGQGRRGVAAAGTSMAAPHVAGAAALVWAAARRVGRAVSAREVAALLVTTADPAVLRATEGQAGTPPLARTGAGALDAWSAVTAETVVTAGALATLDLGPQVLDGGVHTATRPVTLRNLAPEARRYDLSFAYRRPGDEERGLALSVTPATFELGAGDQRTVQVAARFTPAAFPDWSMTGGANVGNATALAQSELDGWLEVVSTATDGAGPRRTARVPFYALTRPAAALTASWSGPDKGPWQLTLANSGVAAGRAEIFDLVGVDGPDPELPARVDLDRLGVRTVPLPKTGTTRVDVLLHTRGERMVPLETEAVVELDTDLDDQADFTVYTADEDLLRTGAFRNGQVIVALEAPGGGPFGSPVLRYHAGVDILARYTVLSFDLEDTGLTPSTARFQLRVRLRDLVERDVVADPQIDQAPDGAAWLRYDARTPAFSVAEPSLTVPSDATAVATVRRGPGHGGAPDARLLVLLPANVPGDGDLVELPARTTAWPALYLPQLQLP